MRQKIRVLSADGIEQFRSIVLSSSSSLIPNFDSIVEEYKLKTYESNYELDSRVILRDSADRLEDKDLDKKNSVAVFEALSGVSWQSLRDEGLWLSLTFGNFHQYVSSRWKITDTIDKKKSLKLHWFTSSSRSLWRDQAITRLWWMGKFCSELDSISSERALDVIFVNSNFANDFFGRPVTISSKVLSESILRRFYTYFFEGNKAKFDRNKFREFMKQLDLTLGAIYVDSLSLDAVDSLVKDLFRDVYEETVE